MILLARCHRSIDENITPYILDLGDSFKHDCVLLLQLAVSLLLIVKVPLPLQLLVHVLSVKVWNDLVRELAEAFFDPA